MQRKVIHEDGTEEALLQAIPMSELLERIGATVLGTVVLHNLGTDPRWVMCVDDLGHKKGLTVNPKATELYHANCVPGTTHQIVGKVVIVDDADFGMLL